MLLAVTVAPRQASAFERQWHVGGGGGLVMPSDAYESGPALALHAAYGISDMFDARFELRGSAHGGREPKGEGAPRSAAVRAFQGTLGLAYKLDIIEWIPYFGVRAGYFLYDARPEAPYAKSGGLIGTMFGVDYAFARHAAIGAELAYDTQFPEGGSASALLRAEYRWGW